MNDFDRTKKNEKKPVTLSPQMRNFIIFVIIALVLNLIAVIYLNVSRSIYYWSTAESWNIAVKIAEGAFYPNLWGEVYKSVLSLDVNYLSALPSALFIKLFGASRISYILSLVNFYLMPANIAIYQLAKKIGKAPAITFVMSLLSVPATVYMAFMGFAEIGGFLICMICMNLYFGKEETAFIRYVFIGLLLTLAILWSNIYLLFSVSFITAVIADAIIYKKKLSYPLMVLGITVAILALFFRSYVVGRIINLYGDASFNFQLKLNIKYLMRYIGVVFVAFELIFSGYIFFKHKEKKIPFLWIQLILCYVMLTATRMHGQLHILLYLPSLTVLYIICIRYIKTERMLIAVTALSIFQTVSVFIPREQPSGVEDIKNYALFPSFSMRARVRSDTNDILTLKTTLDNIVGEGEYLGVLAHSDMMNADLLNNVEPSLNKKQLRRDYIAFTIPVYDSNTPDISPLCNANYMLVGIPEQTTADNQTILRSAVDSFASWTDIALAYEELYEYETYINDVCFKLFRRTRDVTETEKKAFLLKLRNNLTVN